MNNMNSNKKIKPKKIKKALAVNQLRLFLIYIVLIYANL
jgi:hypothetical protein